MIRKLWVITKPGLEKVWALRIKKGCVSVLTQPLLFIQVKDYFCFSELRIKDYD